MPVRWLALCGLLLATCAAPGSGADGPLSASVQGLLAQRAHAVLNHDRAGLRSTVAAGADPAVADLAGRVAALPLTAWSYVVDAVVAGPVSGELIVPAVLHYRTSADHQDVTARRRIRVRAVGSGWQVESDEPVGAALPWDLGVVSWSTGRASDVASLVGQTGQVDLPAAADAAARAVTSVWGSAWRQPPVIVAVADAKGLAALSGRSPAAVVGLVAVSTPDRVNLDVSAFVRLSPAGRQVLLTHEVTHVATRAGADPATPQWLKEGFADYIGFLNSTIGVHVAAADLLARVGGKGGPSSLPPDADFAPGAPAAVAADAYAGAWLWCVLVAERDGQPALVAVYRATAAGRGAEQANVDAALRHITGHSLTDWTSAWLQDLRVRAA